MNKKRSHAHFIEIPSETPEAATAATSTTADTDTEYDDLELLEHLESLQEEMEDLGVSTLAEVVARIAELHQRLDENQ